MKTIEGDLLAMTENGDFDVLVYGCNCQHTMGRGIAKAIRARLPQDRRWAGRRGLAHHRGVDRRSPRR